MVSLLLQYYCGKNYIIIPYCCSLLSIADWTWKNILVNKLRNQLCAGSIDWSLYQQCCQATPLNESSPLIFSDGPITELLTKRDGLEAYCSLCVCADCIGCVFEK